MSVQPHPSDARAKHHAITTEVIRSKGGCGAVSPDGEHACIIDIGHEGPHGWEQPHPSDAQKLSIMDEVARLEARAVAAEEERDAARAALLDANRMFLAAVLAQPDGELTIPENVLVGTDFDAVELTRLDDPGSRSVFRARAVLEGRHRG